MIDLIIPVYNGEETIGRALGSVVAQTRSRKFLVTVIDDCSTDGTAAVVKKFKGLIPLNYIKLDKNLGKPGLVRNIGIEKTHCPYIMFLDADDILAPNAAEVISRAILQQKPDFINSAFYQDNRTDEYTVISTNTFTWLHGNAYSREFLQKNNIKFDDKWNEDGSFNLKCYWLSDKKYVISQPMSYWLDNKESITRKNKNFMLDIAEDYIITYSNAIKYILNNKQDLAFDKIFKRDCAGKLAEFLQILDTIIYNKRDKNKICDVIIKYIQNLKSYNFIDKNFILLTNKYFNNYNIFTDTIRQYTLYPLLSMVKINVEEYI